MKGAFQVETVVPDAAGDKGGVLPGLSGIFKLSKVVEPFVAPFFKGFISTYRNLFHVIRMFRRWQVIFYTL